MFGQSTNSPVLQKLNESLINILSNLVQTNQISNEMANQVFSVGEQYLPDIVSKLQVQHQGQQVNIAELESKAHELVKKIIDSMNQQSYMQPMGQPNMMNNQIPSMMQSPNNIFNSTPQFNSNPIIDNPMASMSHINPLDTSTNIQTDTPIQVDNVEDFNIYSDDELLEFQSQLKHNIIASQGTVQNFFSNLISKKDFNISESRVVKSDNKPIASCLNGYMFRPFFYHTEPLQWLMNKEKRFFKFKNNDPIVFLNLSTKRYSHFNGDCSNMTKSIQKCKSKYGNEGYSYEFISYLKDNNHRTVKIIEQLVIKRINSLLEIYIRSKDDPKRKYQIEILDDIEEILALDLNTNNTLTEHNNFQPRLDKILRTGFNWIFNNNIKINDTIIDSNDVSNILQLLSTNMIKMNHEDFMEFNYFDLNEDKKKEYMELLNQNILFVIPERKIITGFCDPVFLNRFQDSNEVIINELKSNFEIFLSFILSSANIEPTILHIKIPNGFFSVNIGVGLNDELVCKKT